MTPVERDHEARLARVAVRAIAGLAVPVVGLAWALRGPEGGLSALGGLTLVALGQYVSGRSQSWAAGRSLTTLHVVTLGGFLVRLGVYATLILTLSRTTLVDGPALAVAVALAVVVALALETRTVLRESSFWWLDATAHSSPTEAAPAAVTAKDLV